MLGKGTVLPVDSTSLKGKYRTGPIDDVPSFNITDIGISL